MKNLIWKISWKVRAAYCIVDELLMNQIAIMIALKDGIPEVKIESSYEAEDYIHHCIEELDKKIMGMEEGKKKKKSH